MPDSLAWPTAVVVSYLLGSIPFGLLLGKIKGVDLRTLGSGNIGATNALRQLGTTIGIACFILDVGKGVLPVLLAGIWLGTLNSDGFTSTQAWWWVATACAAVTGHMFSVYLRFRGGKGIATTFGAMLALYPFTTIPALLSLGIWILSLLITRYVGVSSCIAVISLPLLIAWRAVQDNDSNAWVTVSPFLLLTSLLMLVVLVKHRGNISRTLAGVEPRIGRNHSMKSSSR